MRHMRGHGKHREETVEPMLFDHPRWWVLMWIGATMGALGLMVLFVWLT